MPTDPFEQFKSKQREIWSHFSPIEVFTTVPASHLVRFAGIKPGQRVLDVGTGTGVAAVTAARQGATVTGLDLSPPLLERARENGKLAEVQVEWTEGDAESLPFADQSFDVVISQFGHMFAPRADVALAQMLRVLKPGGTIAFNTWPPEHLVGRFFVLAASYAPKPPEGFSPPPLWGNVDVIRQRFGDAVSDLRFDRGVMLIATLSLQHYCQLMEETVGPARTLAQSGDAQMLAKFRKEVCALAGEYYADNTLHQHYLTTRAIKR